MPTNFTGWGRALFREANGVVRPTPFSSFTVTSESTSESSEAFPLGSCGPLVEVDVTIPKTTWKLAIAQQSVDAMAIERIFDKKFVTSSTLSVPRTEVFQVPATGPAEVAIAGLTTTETLSVTLLNDIAPGNVPLTRASGASPAVGEFSVAAGEITLNSAQAAGKYVFVYRRVALTTSERSIGGTNAPSSLGNMEFYGTGCNPRMGVFYFWMPKVSRDSGIEFGSGTDEFSTEYKVLTPEGWGEPYIAWTAA